jgi:DNA-directed RNA polymerase specialized sigma24 family protein
MPADNYLDASPMSQPAIGGALAAALEQIQRSVASQAFRHDSTPPNGCEEAYSTIVDELSRPTPTGPSTPSELRRRYRSLARNCSRKERARQNQLKVRFLQRTPPIDPRTVVENKDLLEKARSNMPAEDWALFKQRSLGYTYDEIARRSGGSPKALRKQASRRRAALEPLVK